MAKKGDFNFDSTPYDFIVQIKAQGKITIPISTRKLEDYEIGDWLKVKLGLHKKKDQEKGDEI